MTPEQFREVGHRLIDWLADYRSQLAERPVMAQVQPCEVKNHFPKSPPQDPQSFDEVFKALDESIVPGLSLWAHPQFYGYFPCNGDLSSVLGDVLSTGLGVLGLAWQSSPALTELEEVVTDWLRQMLGLSEQWHGVIQDTASTSTLLAILCAREKSSQFSLLSGGLQAQAQPLRVYVSQYAHSSVDKAALLAGLGKENVQYIACDAHFAMQPEALEAAILSDLAQGYLPSAVVATTGTTTTTALDPIADIAKIAQKYGIWLHVDSAMAGSAMILPECRHMWQGIELADSVVINPHKWLGAAFDCTTYYVRDPEHLIRVMSTNPSYLQSNADGQVKNYRDWGIPLGRRFRALKLYTLIMHEGIAGLQQRLRRDIANAQWFAEQVQNTPNWQVLAPVPLQTVCIRYALPHWDTETASAYNKQWADDLNGSGKAYVTPALLGGEWMVRISVGALNTEKEHVAELWKNIQDSVKKLDSGH